ncbi:MBL fold metallo-hydrolase [Amycolatopsis sp. FDAARGOS 1241]|uniref:MBL fold metallo-hydrolase n=1 Tax=Amycolatopsis sp. FDAARGOS 1241 TaxID=2778070 RepID=UPI00194E67A4|nr:MBL fold metallo-hydrolase [Amycolatopsis sp. FDAARGOS 1241]QRP47606.1 MBL fold metallo-hydrolase [Amycolatopsis sp. FDAARGOS 1241]
MPAIRRNIVPLRYSDPSVVAYVRSPSDWLVSNCGWIRGRSGVLLVDTCGTERDTLDLVNDVRKYSTVELPLTLVLTHAHGAHHNGAGVALRNGGRILAAASAVSAVRAGPQRYEDTFTCTNWGTLEAPKPEAVHAVTTPREVDLGGVVVEVVPFPGVAHTDGDLVAFEPKTGTLFTGDLLSVGSTPLAIHGSVPGWLDALHWLDKTFPTVRTFVPGHGGLSHPGSFPVAVLRTYLNWLLDATAPAGTTDFEGLAAIARRRWPTWSNPERHVGNLMRAHADQHGGGLRRDKAIRAILDAVGGKIDLDARLGL